MPKSKTLTPNFFYLFGTISDSMISQLVKVARAPYSARLATRLFCLGGNHTLAKATLLFCLLLISSSPVLAAFPNDNPVPGGIALVPLKTVMAPKPEVQFGNQSIMVLQNNGRWTAVVGLKRDILPGEYLLTATSEDGSVHSYLFRVNPAPADTPNRIIDLPPKLSDLEFDPDLPSNFIKKLTSNDTEQIESDQSQFASPEQVKHLVPDFEFGQIIKKGRYIPYGLVLTKQEDQNTLIDHSWLTYLTGGINSGMAPLLLVAAVPFSQELEQSARYRQRLADILQEAVLVILHQQDRITTVSGVFQLVSEFFDCTFDEILSVLP